MNDDRIEAAINLAERPHDRAALRVYLEIIKKSPPARRESLWVRFEKNTVRHLRPHIANMHTAYNFIVADSEERQRDFEGWLNQQRTKQRAARRSAGSMEGELKDGA